MPTLFIIIPVFNEEATLEECVRRVERATLPTGVRSRLVLIDDASTDGTAAILQTMRERHSLGQHHENLGKGEAVLSGFDAVLNNLCGSTNDREDLVIIQDADLEYDPADYSVLIEPILTGRTQVVFGSRFGPHRRSTHLTEMVHERGNAVLTSLSNAMTRYDLTDMESCYKVLRLDVLRTIRADLTEPRFGIEPQITAALSRIGETIVEVPISYTPRSFNHGKKIKWTDGVRALYVILRERIRHSFHEEEEA